MRARKRRTTAPVAALAALIVVGRSSGAMAMGPSLAATAPPAHPSTASGSGARPTPASPPADSKESKAEARFRDGSDAFDHGRVDEACAAFAESLRLFATLGTLLNLALCHEKQGKTATAWAEFTEAGAWAGDPAQHDRRDFAHQHATHLEKSLARLRIEGVPDVAGVTVSLDGELLPTARLALPIFVDPGAHTVTASAPGRRAATASVDVSSVVAGDGPVVRIPVLEPEATVAPSTVAAPPLTTPSVPPPRRTAGWVLGGVGVVGVALGVGFAADAISRTGGLASPCSGGCDAAPAKTAEIVSLVSFTAGVGALAAGAWLAFVPPGGAKTNGTAPTASSGTAFYLAPTLGGLRAGGAW